jgi:hypothetical protein
MDLASRPRVGLSEDQENYLKRMIEIHFPGSTKITVREYQPVNEEDPKFGLELIFFNSGHRFYTAICDSVIMPNPGPNRFIYQALKKLEKGKAKYDKIKKK